MLSKVIFLGKLLNMSKNLLIVESPAKAKTIEGYLGKGFAVSSSYGHVRDLSKEGMGINIEEGFEPHYILLDDKKKVIAALRKEVKQATQVYLATDDDREGEAISWHLCEVLGIDTQQARRIVFREITKTAIQGALEHPAPLNMNLVYAQQARRILDRIVGFEVSPILWKKIKYGLSAGRVQSVAVRLVVERTRAIQAFAAQSYFNVAADLKHANGLLHTQLVDKIADQATAQAFLEACKDYNFVVSDLKKTNSKRQPSAPFTTSTLQQEAGRLLSMPVSQTMRWHSACMKGDLSLICGRILCISHKKP